ncbi:MAG: c-type cytochrome domain-containing protein [Bacteroidota bacterium]
MRKLISLLEPVLFALNVFIVFLLLFQNYLVIPTWLQVIGRMHPLFLHFPIVIILLAVTLIFYKASAGNKIPEEISKGLLLLGALSASVTVIMGLFLSFEDDYTGCILHWHKWFGIGVALLASLLYYYIAGYYPLKFSRILGGLTALCLILAGHFGAELTHGQDFLLAPVMPEKIVRQVSLQEAMIYQDIIAPIIDQKCVSCHNPEKAKGNLILTSEEGWKKGGKSGKLFEAGDPDASLLIKRMLLPEDDKKHMPPKGKTPLTQSDMDVLYHWVKSGGDMTKKLIDLHPKDTFRVLLEQHAQLADPVEVYNFSAADDETIKKLNTAYRGVAPLAANSPAVAVTIFNASAYSPKLLEELMPIQRQIVHLNLNRLPVKDDDVRIIARFENLRRLNLNFTDVTGTTLTELKALKHLSVISLSSNKIEARYLASLSALPELKRLYIWNAALSENEITDLRKKLNGVVIESGYVADKGKALRLTPPRIENEKKIFATEFTVSISHPVKGVTIRYTTDGTDPDSIRGVIYKGPIPSAEAVTAIKARAFKDGWYGSDVSTASFYKTAFEPDTVILVTSPDKRYTAKGAMTLMDHESGDVNYGSREGWLGFRDGMDMRVEFGKPVLMEQVTLSTNCDIPAYIFPARRIQVWGGKDKTNLVLLSTIYPQQPDRYVETKQIGLACQFKQQPISYLKIVAEPVPKLPAWHQGKGEKGWLFVDEVLFN